LRPPPEIQKQLIQWFGTVRVTYNWALQSIKNNKVNCSPTDKYQLRHQFITAENIPKHKSFLLDTPKDVRYSAIVDLAQAYKLNFEKRKKDPTHRFNIKFRSKKNEQSFTIPKSAIKTNDNSEMKIYPTYLKNKIKFHVRKNRFFPDIDSDCKLKMDQLKRIYLIVPFYKPACENQTSLHKEWCAIDPGVRTFMTLYSPTPGECYKIGDGDISRVFRLCKHLDTLSSKRGSKVRKAKFRLSQKIKNIVTEVHCKSVNFLLRNFKNIIIPPFNVSQMIKRGHRKLSKKSVRQMLGWRHFGFRQRLIENAKLANVQIYVKGEEYTSKTCTHCRFLKQDLRGAKVYKCQDCSLKVDRDVNGARNIFLKNVLQD